MSSDATSFFDSTDRTFFITGLQLEVGSVATPFEHRSFGEELALCQRYFQDLCKFSSNNTSVANMTHYSATDIYGHVTLNTDMRATPSIAVADVTHFTVYSNGAGKVTTALAPGCTWTTKNIELNATTAAATAGHAGFMRTNNVASSIQLIAEL